MEAVSNAKAIEIAHLSSTLLQLLQLLRLDIALAASKASNDLAAKLIPVTNVSSLLEVLLSNGSHFKQIGLLHFLEGHFLAFLPSITPPHTPQ